MRILTEKALVALLDDIAREKRLIAPVTEAKTVRYRPVDSSAAITFEFARPLLSIKEAFFPRTEPLLTITRQGGGIAVRETLPEGETVVFGVRPCDARGAKSMDALFLGETTPADPYYSRRRQRTTLIGLACREMGESCFCTSVGGAPDDARDVDLMLTEVEGGYAVEVVTPAGKALVQRAHLEERAGSPPPPRLNEPLPIPDRAAWHARYDDDYWEALGERCLSCRLCAYVCPTCRCFDVRDEPLPSNGHTSEIRSFERIRCWDSCTSTNYRAIAGGHNPRAEKGERLRNRFFCKFDYYQTQTGAEACTGCGRCIDVCPVNADVTEVLAWVAQAARKEGAQSEV